MTKAGQKPWEDIRNVSHESLALRRSWKPLHLMGLLEHEATSVALGFCSDVNDLSYSFTQPYNFGYSLSSSYNSYKCKIMIGLVNSSIFRIIPNSEYAVKLKFPK